MISARQSDSSRAAGSASRWVNSRTTLHLGWLLLLVLLTRIPLLGIAEPDSALFTTGARQWLAGGPQAASIYSAKACAFYYAAVTGLVHLLHLEARSCLELMSILSLVAGLGIVAFGYLIGRRFTGADPAFRAMLLFLVSPGLWWVTVEPHPQALSIAFALGAIWSFLRYLETRTSWYWAGSAVSFGLAMAIKNDAVILPTCLLAVVCWVAPNWRSILQAILAGAAGAVLAMGLGRLAVGDAAGSITGGKQALAIAWRTPHLFDLVRDSAPIFFGIGIVTAIALGLAVIAGLRRDADRRRWLTVLALWSLPGYLFWMFVAGNNIRHILVFGIPLFWLGAKYLKARYVAACLVLSLLIPGNSNVFMYPSPNVPFSARLFARKQAQLRELAGQLAQQSSCVVGSYTNDYLVPMLLDKGGKIDSQVSRSDTSTASVSMPNGAVITFKRINPTQKVVQLDSCRSVEYDAAGRKVRSFGAEWHIPIL